MEGVEELRKAYASGITQDVKWRKQQLLSLHRMLVDHEEEACKALFEDLGKVKSSM